jgi:calcineurin-like phosphoesterase family protein
MIEFSNKQVGMIHALHYLIRMTVEANSDMEGFEYLLKRQISNGIYDIKGSGYPTGLITEAAIRSKKPYAVSDHVYSRGMISEYLINKFREKQFSVNWLIDNFPKLSTTIYVTQKENHNLSNRVLTSRMTIEDLFNMEHYKAEGIKLVESPSKRIRTYKQFITERMEGISVHVTTVKISKEAYSKKNIINDELITNRKIFFTADTHFGHENIIKFCNRPFISVEEMNEVLIENWNSVVSDDDEIYHIGDFGWKNNKLNIEILRRLNGIKYLIQGNHDKKLIKDRAIRNEFEWIKDYYELEHEDSFIVMCHYPFKVWNKNYYGAINLFGHSHGKTKTEANQLDVGVDVHNFKPISLDSILLKK